MAADPKIFSDPSRQIGLSHYLLEELSSEDDPESAIESVIDRVVETLRHRISADRPMREFAAGVLADIREKLGDKLTSGDALANAAAFAHVDHNTDPNKVISFLNAFLSTEAFGKSRITTGTVFRKGDEFWMVATPACDLTSRAPGAAQAWMKSIHPVRAMIAVGLRKEELGDALKTATQGRHTFILDGEEMLCFSFLDKTTSTPNPEMFFVMEAGRVVSTEGMSVFRGMSVMRHNDEPHLSDASEYTVVGQLRPNYASRVLQLAGAHLSRIAIDFFNFGGNRDE